MYKRVVFVLVLVSFAPGPSCSNSDNLALLSGTLKTMQRAACDDEVVSLSCPRGTSVSIQVAQYGKVARGGYSCQTAAAVEVAGADRCLWPNSMQYSLLQTVVEACQKKPSCKFSTKPKPGLVDPCNHTRKFVEVAYKCRPVEFRIRSVCEDDVIKLSCNPHSRLAIYEVQYGRTAYEPISCPQPQGVPKESCMALYATETVMQFCHGKRRCEVSANRKTFGTPCKHNTRTHLKIVYACVPLGVLMERYESAVENDEILNNAADGNEDLFDEKDDAPTVIPAAPVANSPYQIIEDDAPTVIPAAPVANSPYQTFEDIGEENQREIDGENIYQTVRDQSDHKSGSSSKLFVYIGIAVGIFFILTVILVGVRCYIIKKSSKRSKTEDMYTTQAPNVFNDAVSDIDNDIDVSHISGTFYEHPDMILYRDEPGGKGTIRAMRPLSSIYPCAGTSMYGNVDYVPTHSREPSSTYGKGVKEEMTVDREAVVSPKSLSRYSSPNFYYG